MSEGRRSTLLLEIGCEEIPSQMIRTANEDLAQGLVRALGPLAEGASVVSEFGGPRRIVAFLRGLALREGDREETVLGPPRGAAFDEAGRPTRAAQGFARKQGVRVEDLDVVSTERGEVVKAVRRVPGRNAEGILSESCPRILSSMRFAKMMRWGDLGYEFVRPVHWIVALLDERVVPFQFAGIQSGRSTRGHRFLGPGPHEIPSAEDYERVLVSAGSVIPRIEERRRRITESALAAAREAGGRLRPDDDLVEELIFLTEHPAVLGGRFPEEFLALPDPVLMTAMRHHQKYLTVEGEDGALLNAFVAVLTTEPDVEGLIRRGNEWVLKARLADAKFFFEEDQKRPLAARVADLEGISFHARLGTYAEKVTRMEALLPALAEALKLDGAAREEVRIAVRLGKTDLTTGMVGEFPELQGVVGGIYARMQGHPEGAARAIEQQYRPASPGDAVPGPGVPACVMLADRIDTLAVCFAAGLIPKGSADPYALRRAALGVLRGIVENRYRLDLEPILDRALLEAGRRAAGGGLAREPGRRERRPRERLDPKAALQEFLKGRLRFLMEESGVRFDAARAALAAGWTDPLLAWRRAGALNDLRGHENFLALAASAKRVRNILSQARGKGIAFGDGGVDAARLAPGAERSLYDAMARSGHEAAECARRDDHAGALSAIAGMRPAVDRFFDDVLVMDPDESVRLNRLALLRDLANLLSQEADFAEIVVEGDSHDS